MTTTATETVKLTFPDGTEVEVTPQELAERMAYSKALPMSLWLSGNVRYIRRGYIPRAGGYEPCYIVVTEQAPSYRRVTYEQDFINHHGPIKEGNVSIPFVINVFVIGVGQDGKLTMNRMWPLSFYRNLPLSGFSDPLSVCNLPNVRIDPWNDSAAKAAVGWTCYHNAPHSITSLSPGKNESEESAVNRMTKGLLDYFWESSFSGSAGAVTAWIETAKKVKGVETMDEWIKNSAADPDFGIKVEWLPHPENATLKDVVLSIQDNLGWVPMPPYVKGEAGIVAPNDEVSMKRLKAIATKPTEVGTKVKLY